MTTLSASPFGHSERHDHRDLRPAILLHRLLGNWRVRRAVTRLERLDDKLLADIGLTHADLGWALALPMSVNCQEGLYGRSLQADRYSAG